MTIELTKGGLRATVDTLGGELVSLRDREGTEYIWQGDPACWSGRNPILFPFVGSLKENRVRFEGRTFEMPRHGFARRREFTIVEQGPDFAVLELRESPETLAQYPYPFLLQVRHQLTGEGFFTQFQVENPGGEPLPFCIGAHTAFRCPLRPGEAFEDYQLVFDEEEKAAARLLNPQGLLRRETETFATPIGLEHAIFDRLDTLIFEGLRSTGVSLLHRATGRGVHMDFGHFPMIAFWTMPHKSAPYICLEPWHGCAAYEDESGEFIRKPHCITLSAGERKLLRYTVRIL